MVVLYLVSAKERWGIVALTGMAAAALGWYGSGYSGGSPPLDPDGDRAFKVDVSGAVRYPRVIEAQPGMIVSDAVEAAGGATSEADLALVNLAAPLLPNSRVYVPFSGEEDLAKLGPYGPGSYAAEYTPTDAQIDINKATAAEFERLPGVGPKTAAAIKSLRDRLGGRFNSIDQLLDVDGIGPKTFQKLRAYVKL
jgi:competence protein ComEA